ncbi:thiol-specific monooxygenase [Cucurbitaria berberidis CBS 394.84]|uniref:Thiol-specific monooxygenase n=1 Tax=Cucurbitaria berberidis CBS 394.84 TaxID=1168544 RepID=A0A9P4GLG9_9PLEO|nr:thiol-specific monooxygenase [Cucurbitaria berberidis CBS 394.84]KAF1847240.1 thiol-specific monooxygenase [Cucurbitaria berberidis CBS 394.84]
MGKVKRRVAVIGAGPAGAIVTDALAKEGVFETIRVFERRHVVGGTWVLTRNKDEVPRIPSLQALLEGRADLPIPIPAILPSETAKDERINSHQSRFSDSGAHEHLHSNLPPEIMCFSNEPIPTLLSERTRAEFGEGAPFRHREVMREWVQAIFNRGGHENLVEHDTTVELAEKKGEEWILTMRKSESEHHQDRWWQETFDAITVATGHYYVPFVPRIPGLIEWEEKFPGSIQHSKHYVDASQYRNKRVIIVGGSVSALDALHDIRKASKLPIISSLRESSQVFGDAPFMHPDIMKRPSIAAFDPDTGRITFADGSYVDDIDVVLFATGYEFSFPFLPQVKPRNGRVPGLYQHVFLANDPSLALVGMVTGSFGLRIFEWQAVSAARVFAGRAKLPTYEEMRAWEQLRLEERGDGPSFWALMPDFERYFEDLRAIAGEPALGTAGRVLPRYDPAWEDTLWRFVDYRIQLWQKEAAKAEATRRQQQP